MSDDLEFVLKSINTIYDKLLELEKNQNKIALTLNNLTTFCENQNRINFAIETKLNRIELELNLKDSSNITEREYTNMAFWKTDKDEIDVELEEDGFDIEIVEDENEININMQEPEGTITTFLMWKDFEKPTTKDLYTELARVCNILRDSGYRKEARELTQKVKGTA